MLARIAIRLYFRVRAWRIALPDLRGPALTDSPPAPNAPPLSSALFVGPPSPPPPYLLPSSLPAQASRSGLLQLDGLAATQLAERFGTPLVVYSEAALRERAQMFLRAVPEALVVFGTKAFPNVAVMRLLAEEGIGADVSTLGELAFARAGRHQGRAARRARQQQVRRGAARRRRGRCTRRPRRARRACARGSRRCAASARARDARRRGRDPRGDPYRRTAAPSSGSTQTMRSRRSRRTRGGLELRRAARPRRLAARGRPGAPARGRGCSRSSRHAAEPSSTGCPSPSTSAAAWGSDTSRRSRSRRSRS